MNITREIGSLISGFLGTRASSPIQRTERGSTNRTGTANRDQPGNQKAKGTPQGSDRVTLSSKSISLASSTQEQTTPYTTAATAQPIQSGEVLALPYSPAAANDPLLLQANEESPATRQLVRDTYGNKEPASTSATPAATRINFLA